MGGFCEQIATNTTLTTFKLINYRLSPTAWEVLGRGLGNAKALRHFACNACNLAQETKSAREDEAGAMIPNLSRLLQGMIIAVKKKPKAPSKKDKVGFANTNEVNGTVCAEKRELTRQEKLLKEREKENKRRSGEPFVFNFEHKKE